MLKKSTVILLCLTSSLSNSTQAASQDECAIWLCLPGGFPSGCSGAYSAMKNRVKKFKPPLPSFSSCAMDGSSSGMLSKDGRAAEIHHGQSWVKGTTCQRVGGDNRKYRPSGCTGSGYYAEVYSDGKQMGETYYFMP